MDVRSKSAKGFSLWALVDNNGSFEQPGGIEESRGTERNDESYHSVNFEQPGGIEESGGMERNDESYNSMIFEQPGRIEESGGMERNDKSYNSLNAFHKAGQATSFYKVKGNEEAVSAQNGKAARLVHIKRAKVVRPVHAKRTYRASHTRQSSSAQTTSSARCSRQWSHCGRRAAQTCVRTWRPWRA